MTTTMNTKPTTTILLRTILIITNPIRIFFPFLASYSDEHYPYLITKYNLFQSIPLVVQQPESTSLSLSSSLSSSLNPTILPVLFHAVIGIVIGIYYGYYICYRNYKKYSIEQQEKQQQTGRYTWAFTTTTNYSNNGNNNNNNGNNNNDDEEILLQTISQQYRIEYYYLWFVAFVSYGGMNASAIGYQLLLYPTTTIIATTTSLNEPSNTSSSSSYSLLSGGDMTNLTTTTTTTKLLLYQSRTIFWACDCYCTGIAAIGMILSFIVVFQLLLVPTHVRMNLLNQLYYHSQIHDQNNNNNNNTNNNNRTQQDQQDVGDENASDMSPTKTTESKQQQQQQQQQQQNNKYSTGNDRDKNSKDTTDDFNNDTSFVVSSKDEIPSSLSLLSPSSYYYYRIWKFVAWIGFIVGILTLYYVLIDIPNSIHPSTNNRNGTIPIFPYTAFLELWYVLPSELCVVVGFVVTTILYIEDRKVIQKNSNRNWNLYYSWPYYAMFLSPFVFFMGLFCEGYIITWFQTIVTPWIMNTTTTTTTTILPFVLLIRRFVYYIVYWIGYGTTATPMAFFGTNIAFLGIGNWIHTNFPIIFSNQFGNNNNNNDDDDHTKDDDDKNKSSNKNSKNIDSSKSIREKKDI